MPISAKQKRVDFVHSLLFYPVLWIAKGLYCNHITTLYDSRQQKAAKSCGFLTIDIKENPPY